MDTPKKKDQPAVTVLRWIARIWSLLVIVVLLLMIVGIAFDFSRITPAEWLGLLFFPIGLLVGMVLAWWKEGLGAVIILVGLLGFFVFGDLNPDAYLPSLLFAGPGFLFLACWLLSRRAKAGGVAGGTT
jgi:hypothetical protein